MPVLIGTRPNETPAGSHGSLRRQCSLLPQDPLPVLLSSVSSASCGPTCSTELTARQKLRYVSKQPGALVPVTLLKASCSPGRGPGPASFSRLTAPLGRPCFSGGVSPAGGLPCPPSRQDAEAHSGTHLSLLCFWSIRRTRAPERSPDSSGRQTRALGRPLGLVPPRGPPLARPLLFWMLLVGPPATHMGRRLQPQTKQAWGLP